MDPAPDNPDPSAARRSWLRPALFLAVLVGLFVLARVLDLEGGLESVRSWIDELGPWGPVAFVGVYILATILMVPGAIPTIMAGGLFGAACGTVYASLGSTIGAALSFLIARYLAKAQVDAWLTKKPGLARIDQLTLTHGALIVAVIRMVPLFPFNLVNYAFGLTRVSFWRYVLVSWIAMLPGTFLYVAGTDVVLESLASGEAPLGLLAVVAVVLVGVVLLGRQAARRLRHVEAAEALEPTAYEESP
ncbi:MAG: TVP38/TMEM64 family protein [Planctomycetota bacterium]|nr:TVP38/TMEM64 family protein [Planctomycetota bacterium]